MKLPNGDRAEISMQKLVGLPNSIGDRLVIELSFRLLKNCGSPDTSPPSIELPVVLPMVRV
ncbi:MAG: hypothetical protein GDA48_26890 [Hormoscilla sp. GM102CHS1]|nr:hypothetical protein [Hormoscilla sp. GM102CHS1]